jgi:hypothetical protein
VEGRLLRLYVPSPFRGCGNTFTGQPQRRKASANEDLRFQKKRFREAALREAFAALEILDYRRSFDECVELVRKALG